MGKIYNSIVELVGNTPLLRLNRFEEELGIEANILAKLEYFNPTSSIKDRIAVAMIEDAEAAGKIKKGGFFAETTSGNTGISLAAFATVKGYKFQPYMSKNVSEERSKVIRAYGADLVYQEDVPEAKKALDENNGDFVAGTAAIKKKLAEQGVFVMNQMFNPKNPGGHYESTGKEIWEDTDGKVDVLVSSVGTGGTISGTGRYLKEKNPDIKIIAVEPAAGEFDITGIHRFSDVPENHFPGNLDRAVYDEVITAPQDEAKKAAREVARTDGILVGVSSGAALYAAKLLAKRPEYKGKNIAVILPDTGLRYLSTDLFE
ncbi:MAG: pyridoxal-phosphate dependent enzyme [Treponemataceae bacterium]|nr:pyridoxal-phosphate dependent enzyme [Treponemataceae bacterium]